MSATLLRFPTSPAEPPVDPAETLEAALRRHALDCLAAVDPELARRLATLYAATDALSRAEALAALEGPQ